MPSLEAVCGRLFGKPGWVPKALVGGLLSFVPFLNLLALGFLMEYGHRLRSRGTWELPDWREVNLPELLTEGFRGFVLLLGYIGIPLLAGWLVSGMIDILTFGLLGIVSFFPLAATGFVAPFLFLSSLNAYLRDGIFSDCWQLRPIIANAKNLWPQMALPIIAFWGILLLALPLYGFSFFIGTWVLIAYSTTLQFSD